MKKFILYSIIFIASFFLFDKIFYVFLYISPKLEKDTRLEQILQGKVNKDIIIMGSSRGEADINAKQIQDSLHLSTINLAYSGSNIIFHEFLLRTLLKYNSKPKMIIIPLDDPSELQYNNTINFRFDRLYPLVKYNYINDEMIRQKQKNILSRYFVLARINKTNFKIFNNLAPEKKNKSQKKNKKDKKQLLYKSSIKKYDRKKDLPEKINAFLLFHLTCINNNIQIVYVFPPNFKKLNPAFQLRIKELTENYPFFYCYDTFKTEYRNKIYFSDESHLNKNGARLFTNEIISYIKTTILNNSN